MGTAFVLAGGGSIGAVQVGMLRELLAHGVRPDLVVGSSAGAINGAYLAGTPGVEGVQRLEALWRGLQRRQVFPITWRSMMGAVTRRGSLVDPGGLRRLLEAHLPYEEIERAAIPLHVVATDLLGGGLVKLSSGSVTDAVLASCAIPGAFPPVRIADRYLVDGAVASNTPIRIAKELGATRVVVLPSGYACALESAPRGAIATALHAITLLIAHQLVADLERWGGEVEIVTVPPLCPLAVSPYDFTRAGELIERAAAQTRRWLQQGGLEKQRIPGALRPHEDEGLRRPQAVLPNVQIPRRRSFKELPMRLKAIAPVIGASIIGLSMLAGFGAGIGEQGNAQADESRDREGHGKRLPENDRKIKAYAERLLEEGRNIFRFDTYGSEAFFGDALQLHRAIAGTKNGGVGPGVSPKTALAVGLKVDADALPQRLKQQIKAGKVNLDDPATTLALLKLNAVVGLTGRFDDAGRMTSLGTQCALCHSNVDDSFAPGIGKRLDGWANRDLNIGVIVSLAPNLRPFTDLLRVDEATVRKVLTSWGPGCYDAWLDKDGKGLRPDGGRACTLIPPAFGLAGVNLHTWTGSGSVPYWNAYVAVTQQHGSGTFFDPRLGNEDQYPVSARSGSFNTRGTPDLVTSKLAALHFYQIAIPAPKAPEGSFDKVAAARGKEVFNGRAQCATCHVPPLFTEPGHALHTPAEMGVDSFQADRSPTLMYRTAPLAGLWTHQKGGFYHDGRFATLPAVIDHYDRTFRLGLTGQEKAELVEYLKSL